MDWGEVLVDTPANPPVEPEVVRVPETPKASLVKNLSEPAMDSAVPFVPTIHLQGPAVQLAAPRPEPVLHKAKQAYVPRSTAVLLLDDGAGGEASFSISGDVSIGRRSKNDISIQDLHVSGHHARISLLEDDRYGLEDLDSTGGTFVNDKPVKHHVLQNGDVILFATVAATFRYVTGPHCGADDDDGGTMVVKVKKLTPGAASKPKPAFSRLLVTLPDGATSELVVDRELTIGRSPDNDVVISDTHVSGRHAKLTPTPGGGVELTDLESTCGTHVNGLRIFGKLLMDGDEILLGSVKAVFQQQAAV